MMLQRLVLYCLAGMATVVTAQFNRVSCQLCVRDGYHYCVNQQEDSCQTDCSGQGVYSEYEMSLERRSDCLLASEYGAVLSLILVILLAAVMLLCHRWYMSLIDIMSSNVQTTHHEAMESNTDNHSDTA